MFSAFMTLHVLDLELVRDLLSSMAAIWTLCLIETRCFAGFQRPIYRRGKLADASSAMQRSLNLDIFKTRLDLLLWAQSE